MSSVKAYKFGERGTPAFPDNFEIAKKAVLQVTDIKTNHNKYYAIELHTAKSKNKPVFRVFTHYGRTDDLETNPDAGQKECRFFNTLVDAQSNYDSIYREKTSSRKGYKELSLASSKIGSQKARGTSSGTIDAKTASKLEGQKNKVKNKLAPKVDLSTGVEELIRYIYSEATEALTNTVSAQITANGIETPLGVLTIGQIEKGEEILHTLYDMFKKKGTKSRARMEELSGEFYTLIPHRIGRSRSAVKSAVIDSLEDFQQKQDTLQLMKDMLKVNGDAGNVLFNDEVGSKYLALDCKIEHLASSSKEHQEIANHVIKSQVDSRGIKVMNVFKLKREKEWKAFTDHISNQKLLFHGSNIKNWVGILSRGILLPKIVVSMGVDRTDEGWLGSGIYFGDASTTAANYAYPGKKKTSFMAVTRVALGKIKDYNEITYGLTKPPSGYHSCHGVRGTEFDDDEFVIYDGAQQRLEYLVEFKH